MFTMEVASPGAQRQSQASREKMEQRFFLNWVNGYRGDLSVIKDIKDAAIVSAHPANPEFARPDNTTPLAYIAAHPRVRKLFIKQSLRHMPTPP
jgi:hypothetical protein